MSFWDIISLCLFAVLLLPLVLFVFDKHLTHQFLHLLLIIGIVICELIIKVTRLVFPKVGVFLRPAGAVNCNICNGGGDYTGKVGMPSGHVALTTFVFCALLQIYNSRLKGLIRYVAYAVVITSICLMGLSRYYRKCHNIVQIITGVLLGIVLTWLYVHVASLVVPDFE